MRMNRTPHINLLILFIILFGYTSVTFATRLTTSVDRTSIIQGQRFNLIISIDGRDLMGSPDLSSLQKDFEVLGTARNQSIVMINGNITRKNQWIITLIANKRGEQTIPPVTFGGLRTHPVTITVITPSKATVGKNQPLFFKASVDTKNLYIQSELIYTLRLYYNVAIDAPVIILPTIKNAIIKEIGRYKTYQGELNGRPMYIYQHQYAIYPQVSGKFTISSATFAGNTKEAISNAPVDQSFFSFDSQLRIKPIRLFSKPITVDVRPRPVASTSAWWLPAKQIKVTESWSHDLKQVKLGEPLTRTVTIEATGLTAAQLPQLNTAVSNEIKSYPGEPKLIDRIENYQLIGMRTEKIAYIPSVAGNFTLPAMNIPWWNTTTDRAETATLPEHTIHIIAPTTSSMPQNLNPNQIQNRSISSQLEPVPIIGSSSNSLRKIVSHINYWLWIAVFLMIGALLTLVIWYRRRKRNDKDSFVKRAPSKRQYFSEVKKACDKNDPIKVKENLLAWAREEWPEKSIRNLGDFASQFESSDLKRAVHELDKIIYSKIQENGKNRKIRRNRIDNEISSCWDGVNFWKLFDDTLSLRRSKAKSCKDKNELLPTLYLSE